MTHPQTREEREVRRTLLELLRLGLSNNELSRLFGNVDPNTIRRWTAGENLSRFSDFSRIQLLQEILSLARQAFGDEAGTWFNEPNPALGNVLPSTLLRDPGNGPGLVRQVLVDALSGAVA